jgi:WD40 repeat protein
MFEFRSVGYAFLVCVSIGLAALAQERNVEIVDETNPNLQNAMLVWATDESWIAAAGFQDGVIHIYDMASGSMSRQIVIAKNDSNTVVAVPSRTQIAVSTSQVLGLGSPGSIDVYDVVSGEKVFSADDSHGCTVLSIERNQIKGSCFRQTSSFLRPVGYASSVKFWDLTTGKLLREEPAGASDAFNRMSKSDGTWVVQMSTASVGKQMLSSVLHRNDTAQAVQGMYRFRITDTATNQLLMEGQGMVSAISQKPHTAILPTADGVFLVDVPSGKRIRKLGVGALTSTNGKWNLQAINGGSAVLSGTEYLLTGLTASSLVDAATGETLATLPGINGGVVSPSGNRIASLQGNTLLLVSLSDTSKRQILGNPTGPTVPAPDISELYSSVQAPTEAQSKKEVRQMQKDELKADQKFEKTLPKFNGAKRVQMEEDHAREVNRQREVRNPSSSGANAEATREYVNQKWNSYKQFGGPVMLPPEVEFLDSGRVMAVLGADLSWNSWDVATGNHLPFKAVAIDYMKLYESYAALDGGTKANGRTDASYRLVRKQLEATSLGPPKSTDPPTLPAAVNDLACSSHSGEYLVDFKLKIDPKRWKTGQHLVDSSILRSSDGTSIDLVSKGIDFSVLAEGEPYRLANSAAHCALSDDGKYVVVERLAQMSDREKSRLRRESLTRGVSSNQSAALVLYETASGKRICELEDSRDQDANNVAFSPSLRYIATGATLWDAKTCRKSAAGPGHMGAALGFSADDRYFYNFAPESKEAGTRFGVQVSRTRFGVQVIDVRTGKTVATLPDVNANIDLINSTEDGRILTGADRDNALGFWDLQTGTRLASMRAMQEGEWLITTPSGFFDGSPRGWTQIRWRVPGQGLTTQPGEIFFNEFYRPGLLSEVLQGRVPAPPRNIEQVDRRQPSVHISAGDTKIAVREAKITIAVEEAPPDSQRNEPGGVRDVRLFRNGTLVKVWRGEAKLQGGKATIEAVLPLESGRNQFVAYAFNRDNVKSADAAVTVESTAPKLPGTTYILTAGVNQYSNPAFNLKFAAPDATTFAQRVAESQRKLDTSRNLVQVSLLNQDALRANIRLALALLAGEYRGAPPASAPKQLAQLKAAQPEDTVIVYFAGHGIAWGDRFYLVPHDLGYTGSRDNLKDSIQTVLRSSISDQDLETAFEPMQAGHSLLIIDACNSGKVLDSEEQRRGPMNNRGLAQLAYEKGMYVLTAAQSYQAALESSRLGHGYLTYALAEEGLTSADADKQPTDGQITAAEWFEYASRRVPEMQAEAMAQAAQAGRILTFEAAAPNSHTEDSGRLQTPRVYYRRELGGADTVVAVLK